MIEKGKKNNNYIQKKTNDEHVKSKKEMLLSKFINQTTRTEPLSNTDKIMVANSELKYKENNKDEEVKSEILKLKQQVKLEKEKRQNVNNKLSKLDKKYNKTLSDLEDANKKIVELEKIIVNSDRQKNKILQQQSFHDMEIKSWEKQYKIINDSLKNKDSIIQSLTEKNKNKRDLIIELSKKDIVEKKDEEITDLKRERDELYDRIKTLNKQIDVFKFDKNIINKRIEIQMKIAENAKSELTEKLNENKKNVILIFFKDKIRKVIYYIKYKFKILKREIKIKRKRYISKEKRVYGILKNKGVFGYYFIDLNGREFKKIDRKTLRNKPFFDGINCVVNITDKNIIKVLRTYPTKESIELDNNINAQQKIKKKTKTTNKEKDKYGVNLNVLIITAMAGSNYKKNLRELGLNVDIFNSYDENAKRLSAILSKYDIVFYCIRHSKHYCNDIIKSQNDYTNNSLKYNFLDNDSILNMLSIIDNYIEKNNESNSEKIKELISVDGENDNILNSDSN
jgi:hypothetical protein